ncbi:MAG: TolC family protein [Myxococcales bacterium]|nr:TolC family protein [Myxococcales bacterium]
MSAAAPASSASSAGSSRSTRSISARRSRRPWRARSPSARWPAAGSRLSRRAIELANENIKIETDRFNLGKSTNFDVLNRLEELRQAELRKTSALIDWHKAEAVVQALTGDILPTYGIAIQ